jgi:hypothetical protein
MALAAAERWHSSGPIALARQPSVSVTHESPAMTNETARPLSEIGASPSQRSRRASAPCSTAMSLIDRRPSRQISVASSPSVAIAAGAIRRIGRPRNVVKANAHTHTIRICHVLLTPAPRCLSARPGWVSITNSQPALSSPPMIAR